MTDEATTTFGEPPPLPDETSARRLADAYGLPVGAAPPAPRAEQPAPRAPGLRGRLAGKSASDVVKAIGRRARRRLSRGAAPGVGAAIASALARDPSLPTAAHVGDLDARLTVVESRLAGIEATMATLVAQVGATAEGDPGPKASAINQELFKAELASFRAVVDDLGMAIAPATGVAGVPQRFAELRTRLDVLDKRVRAALAGHAEHADAPALPATFDYVGFETRFRGDADVVLARTRERYFARLADASPVLDVGCGRGEVLAALAAEGVTGVGIDLDPAMVAEARARGVDAREGDAIGWLHDQEPGTLGAVVALQVVEHLQLDALLTLVELAWSRLRPGGLLILETPNPASLIVLGNSYLLDPTHVRPLHPSLLSFLVERAGFTDVRLEFYEPASDYHLRAVDDDVPGADTINAAFARLNDVLFGPQDYAVIARR